MTEWRKIKLSEPWEKMKTLQPWENENSAFSASGKMGKEIFTNSFACFILVNYFNNTHVYFHGEATRL